MSSSSIKSKAVMITGGGQGLGRAYALSFATAGANVIIADRNVATANAVQKEISDAGGSSMAVEMNVSNEESVNSGYKEIQAAVGGVDVLINNAAIFSTLIMKPFDEITVDEWSSVLEVNVTGAFLCARAVLPHMRERKWGRIINISSATVTMGRPMYLHYVTSKAALIGMTRSLAREVGADGVNVNCVLPGATETEISRETVSQSQIEQVISMQCIPRRESPEDLVGVVRFLAGEESGFVTGQCITVDGGLTHT